MGAKQSVVDLYRTNNLVISLAGDDLSDDIVHDGDEKSREIPQAPTLAITFSDQTQDMKYLRGTFVYVVGSYKAGKTFLVEKILARMGVQTVPKTSHPVFNTIGQTIHSVHFHGTDPNSWIHVVDTEGLNQPMDTKRSDVVKALISEQVTNSANVIIYMVDKFFESEWVLFNDILDQCRSRSPAPVVFFVHNNLPRGDHIMDEYIKRICRNNKNIMAKSGLVTTTSGSLQAQHLFMSKEENNLSTINNDVLEKLYSAVTTAQCQEDRDLVRDIARSLDAFNESPSWRCEFNQSGFTVPAKLQQAQTFNLRARPTYVCVPGQISEVFDEKEYVTHIENVFVSLPFCVVSSLTISFPSDTKLELKYRELSIGDSSTATIIRNLEREGTSCGASAALASGQIPYVDVSRFIFLRKAADRKAVSVAFTQKSIRVSSELGLIHFIVKLNS